MHPEKHTNYSLLRALLRGVSLVIWTLLCIPLASLFLALGMQSMRGHVAQTYLIVAMRLIGVHLRVEGMPALLRPLMIVANHASYLDVFVLGSRLPVSFTPKREVRRWPLVGYLCVLSDCVFVERRPAHMEEARAEMSKRIDGGRVLCLFPEGTTSDGKNLKPFKSGFLSLADDYHLPVQPVSIAYTHIGDVPIADHDRARVAWIGEATFFGHFLQLLGMPGIRATLRWHEPLRMGDFADRKALTKSAQTTIASAVLTDLAGAP